MPFTSDDDAPWWVRAGLPEPWADVVVREVPAELLGVVAGAELEPAPPCDCAHCEEPVTRPTDVLGVPDSLADEFRRAWGQVQRHTARAWRAVAAMHEHVRAERGPAAAEHVGADLALMMNVHPRTGELLLVTALRAGRDVPELAALVESGELSGRHVEALLDEVGRWTDTEERAREVIGLTLDRCRERAAEHGWPTPGALRKRLRTAALLLDLRAAEKCKKSVAERRGVRLSQSGVGAAVLTVEGPDVMVVQMMDAIRARAEALGRLPGDTRCLDQRLFDAANELLCVDADGGESSVPTVDEHGVPVTIRVRGVEVSVLVPYSVLAGGELELAEIPGLGPVLPSTARELLAQAEHVRRVAVDADTGQVLAVDDRLPGPGRRPVPIASDERDDEEPGEPDERDERDAPDDAEPDDDEPGGGRGGGGPDTPPDRGPSPSSSETLAPDADDARDDATEGAAVRALLERLATDPVVHRDLRSSSYRVNGRIRRFIELRDRTCTFPACTVPGRWCDADHREPWPLGPTDRENCHCVCRRHHRAKQGYFTVTLDPDTGDTLWTTPDRRTYRRPPPTF